MNLPQWVVDWAQVLGAAFGALALVLALVALRKARGDATREARRQHELELLRDIGPIVGRVEHAAKGVDVGVEGVLAEEWHDLRTRLLLMGDPDDLPLTRVAVDAKPSDRAKRDFDREFGAQVREKEQEPDLDPLTDAWWAVEKVHLFRLALVGKSPDAATSSILRHELDAAIDSRMK